MSTTNVRGGQIKDDDVGREDLNADTTGRAVIKKLIAGLGTQISSTGVDSGTGDVTITVPGSPTSFTVTTTDATQTVLATLTPSGNAVSWFKINLSARLNDTGQNKSYWAEIKGAVRRNNNGSAAIVGTALIVEDNENNSYSATISVSGNNLQVLVTGAAAETVHWSGTLSYQEAN